MKSLSPRQADVLGLLLAGAAQKQIASLLGLSDKTVHAHVAQIRNRIGVPLMSLAIHDPAMARDLYRRGLSLLPGGRDADPS